MRRRSWRRDALLFAAGAASAFGIGAAVASEIGSKNIRETSRSHGTSIVSVRPTGVGLPIVGAEGTVGAGDYAPELRHYHDSGLYARDLEAVGTRARRYFVRKVRRVRRAAARRCARARANGVRGARLVRACRRPKLAIVLDIDETSLSNYECLSATGFSQPTGATVVCAGQANTPPIRPTLAIYRLARRKGVGVFFITGRPETIPLARRQTEANLRAAGYTKWREVVLAPDISFDTIAYKRGERRRIQRQGFRIVLNLGDQESDLQGGYADRAYKYPNPFYFIGR